MTNIILFIIFIIISPVKAQTDIDIDTLLARTYGYIDTNKQKPGTHYECFTVSLFPFFATNEAWPPIGDVYKRYTDKGYCYFRFYDVESLHFIFSSMSYYTLRGVDKPILKVFRLYFYIKQSGQWVQEMDPLVAIFDLKNGTYIPRIID